MELTVRASIKWCKSEGVDIFKIFRMAPEVVITETMRDETYDAKVNVYAFAKYIP